MRLWLLFSISVFALATSPSAREPNHLLGAESPYLLQHLYNPVDWYPWGPEALDKAKKERKPIFISVGYSSCHWCHVMEDESFEDESIAALLNEHFVSIKIDRERRPDLDEQFMFATQVMTGGGGWPNSVFLTPEGDPFFAGGYFPPEAFKSVILQVHQAWRQDPGFISHEAAKVTRAVSRYLAQTADVREITPEALRQATDSVLGQLDPFNGGFGVAPKFPRESLFLFLLDQAQRTGDRETLQAVIDMLDGMIKGGIHDHVGGGFHRYAIDPEWHVPHFEKMLYTQAMAGRLLVRAWGITGAPRYGRAAERLFDYVLRELQDPGGAFFSAQDADSLNPAGERAEGAFYTWTPSDLEPLGDDARIVQEAFQVTKDGELDGANVLNLYGLPTEIAADVGLDPSEISAHIDDLLEDMYAMRNERQAPFLDRKVVVSWNAMMIETLAEASHRLDKPVYYRAAEAAAHFILDNMTTSDGLSRVWFEGSAGVPGQLPDYAGLALALIALHDHAPSRELGDMWLRKAHALANDVRSRFGAKDNGYRMTETRDGLSELIPIDDTEIPSGNALALKLFARLSHRMQAPQIEQDGFRLAAALSGNAIDIPEQRGFALKAIQELQFGETGPVRYAAKGTVRVELHHDRESGDIALEISIAEGWHINARQPLDDYFIATDLAIIDYPELAVQYPDPVIKSLAFSDAPLALYEGTVRLSALGSLVGNVDLTRQAALTLQACSDQICLQPEELIFVLW